MDEFDITYICFDTHEKKIYEEDINIVYISHHGSFVKKGIRFINTCRKHINQNHFDAIFVVYFQTSFLLGLMFRRKNIILDIRTGAVWYDEKKRKIDNLIIRFESFFFKKITLISECLRKRLKINKDKTHILPLGSDSIATNEKSFEGLKLLYVGGFNNRNIDETIYGFKNFLDKKNYSINIQYDIIGYGHDFEEEKILKAIKDTNLSQFITFHGKITYKKLTPYFIESNVGICHVPVTDYFNCQPSTKLFEYVNSGLICMATDTDENRAYINTDNGILYMDNAESFSESLTKLYDNRKTYDSSNIRDTLKKYSWENIVKNNLSPHLKNISK